MESKFQGPKLFLTENDENNNAHSVTEDVKINLIITDPTTGECEIEAPYNLLVAIPVLTFQKNGVLPEEN